MSNLVGSLDDHFSVDGSYQAGWGHEADVACWQRWHCRLLKVIPSLEQTLCTVKGGNGGCWRLSLSLEQTPMLSKVELGAVEGGIAVTGTDATCCWRWQALGLLMVAPSLEQQRLHAVSQGSGHLGETEGFSEGIDFLSSFFSLSLTKK